MKADDPIQRDARRAQRYGRIQRKPQTSDEAAQARARCEAEAKERQREWRLAERLVARRRQR